MGVKNISEINIRKQELIQPFEKMERDPFPMCMGKRSLVGNHFFINIQYSERNSEISF
jgi:hypothetical protein